MRGAVTLLCQAILLLVLRDAGILSVSAPLVASASGS
jgi:hypothetical protein